MVTVVLRFFFVNRSHDFFSCSNYFSNSAQFLTTITAVTKTASWFIFSVRNFQSPLLLTVPHMHGRCLFRVSRGARVRITHSHVQSSLSKLRLIFNNISFILQPFLKTDSFFEKYLKSNVR